MLFQPVTRLFLIRLAFFAVTMAIVTVVCILFIPDPAFRYVSFPCLALSAIFWFGLWKRENGPMSGTPGGK